MPEAQTATDLDRRALIYSALTRRNRLIGALRWGFPILGVAVLGALLVQIIIANIANSFGIDDILIARDRLVLGTPEYAGVMGNGTQYKIVAEAASTPLSGSDNVDLDRATMDLVRPDGYTVNIVAEAAQFSLSQQTVEVKREMVVTDNDGMRAQLLNTIIDWQAQTLIAKDNVHATFTDGSVLTGSSLVYDAAAQTWTFDFVKMTLNPNSEAQ